MKTPFPYKKVVPYKQINIYDVIPNKENVKITKG